MRLRTRSLAAGTLASAAVLTVSLVAPVAAQAAPAPAVSRTALVQTDTTSSRTAAATRATRAASAAVALRLKAAAIGKRKAGRAAYRAGATGPNAFDCSGFTSWVWRQVGRSIPHSSRAQYAALKPISRSQARAGDLVFFFRGGVHHVGLYLGNGRMVHAANPKNDVLVSSIDGPWYGQHFSGFRRVV